jgi:NDP-sugar pyrophosphorylase family protein
MDRAIIGDYAEVNDSIIGRHVAVNSSQKRPTKICEVSVIADDVTLEEGTLLVGSKIHPHQKVRGEYRNQNL